MFALKFLVRGSNFRTKIEHGASKKKNDIIKRNIAAGIKGPSKLLFKKKNIGRHRALF